MEEASTYIYMCFFYEQLILIKITSLMHSAKNVKLGRREDRSLLFAMLFIASQATEMTLPAGLGFIQLQTSSASVAMNDLDGFIIKLPTMLRNTKKVNTSLNERGWSKRMHGF